MRPSSRLNKICTNKTVSGGVHLSHGQKALYMHLVCPDRAGGSHTRRPQTVHGWMTGGWARQGRCYAMHPDTAGCPSFHRRLKLGQIGYVASPASSATVSAAASGSVDIITGPLTNYRRFRACNQLRRSSYERSKCTRSGGAIPNGGLGIHDLRAGETHVGPKIHGRARPHLRGGVGPHSGSDPPAADRLGLEEQG